MSSTNWDKKQPNESEAEYEKRRRRIDDAKYFLGKLMIAGGSKAEARQAHQLLLERFSHNQIVKPDETPRHDAIRQGQMDVILFIQQCIKDATKPKEAK